MRSGNKNLSVELYQLIAKKRITSAAELIDLNSPIAREGPELRRILARLRDKLLDFLFLNSEDQHFQLRKARIRIDLRFGCYGLRNLESHLSAAIELAVSMESAKDIIQLIDQQEVLLYATAPGRLSKSVHNLQWALRTHGLHWQHSFPCWWLYATSRHLRLSFADPSEAQPVLQHPAFGRVELLTPEDQAFLLRARLNLAYVLGDWNAYATAYHAFTQLVMADKGPLNYHRVLLPVYLVNMGLGALEAENDGLYQEAHNILSKPPDFHSHDLDNWAIQLWRLELLKGMKATAYDQALISADKAKEMISGRGLPAHLMIEISGMLAQSAYHHMKYEIAAKHSTEFLLKGTPNHSLTLLHSMIRCLCYIQTGHFDKLGAAAKQAISMMGKNRTGPLESLFFSCLAGVTIATTRKELIEKLKLIKPELSQALHLRKYELIVKILNLKDWLESEVK